MQVVKVGKTIATIDVQLKEEGAGVLVAQVGSAGVELILGGCRVCTPSCIMVAAPFCLPGWPPHWLDAARPLLLFFW